ncbi:MAG: hypothetical protein APR56_08270 [Methanosaeta sp. SDB]|nr:MAG: hypothetical protein APR56_08270 [Methanosaeta sp. SDB]
MAKGGPVSETEEAEILEALKSGRSVRDVAGEFDRALSTISEVAKRNGLDLSERAAIKKAEIARTCYDSIARIKLIGRGMDKAAELLPQITSPRDLKDWSVAVAVLADKRRLEESTDPSSRGGEIRILFEKMGDGEEARE